MVTDSQVGEPPQGFPPPGSAADGRQGAQTSTGWDMGVYTHWGGAGIGGAGGDWGVYHPPLEQSCTVHCNLSYHGLMSGGGAESGNTHIHAMVASARSGYPGGEGGECNSGWGEVRRGQKNWREREIRVGKYEGRGTIQLV